MSAHEKTQEIAISLILYVTLTLSVVSYPSALNNHSLSYNNYDNKCL